MLKKVLFALSICHFCTSASLSADDTYWDARLVRSYVHHSEMQRRWAMAFLAPHLRQLRGDESILDIGCGDGKITADVSKFIPQGQILGIDPSLPMLDWAHKQYGSLEYPNLSFQEGGFLEPNLAESFDLIISNCALQHCADQSHAFKSMSGLLKPGGKVLIMIPAIDNPAWKQARKIMQSSPKWAAYWQSIPPRKFLTVEEYADLLKGANFLPQRIEKVSTQDSFIDREELLSFLLGTFTPAVPPEMAREFYNGMIEEYLRLLPEAMNAEGVIEMRYGRIEIEAIKQ
ncbi:class I SAM-dependent methyltransferase [Candidatus Protochlamydia phocaeensis]|uniref:class I SAM-dependent methyltransferase n=1 Tax=Candidatus Protochlamydia phocaeensis TaxID=1414722 RepID=UPI000839543C|nr:class I SAM-dependent methyltransferase [Candidatus Protochlamydia phocaeensis]